MKADQPASEENLDNEREEKWIISMKRLEEWSKQ